MSLELRLFKNAECTKECTFKEYRRIQLDLKNPQLFSRTVAKVNKIGDPRYGEPKYLYKNLKRISYNISTDTPKEFIDSMGIFVNSKMICTNVVKGYKNVSNAINSLYYDIGDLYFELMQEHDNLI